jgi:preprotein translocase subunit SecE
MAEENDGIANKPKQWWLTTREFWRDTNAEMKKVTWPARQEVVGTTVVVLIATIVFAVYLWGADQIFFFLTTKLFSYFGAST